MCSPGKPAPKSILIDAFSIVLGGRASGDYLRKGADSYWIQAVFDIEGLENVHDILRELDLDLGKIPCSSAGRSLPEARARPL